MREDLWLLGIGLVAYVSTSNFTIYGNAVLLILVILSSMHYWALTKALLGLITFRVNTDSNVWHPLFEISAYCLIMASLVPFQSDVSMMVFFYAIPWILSYGALTLMTILISTNVIEYQEIDEDNDDE